MNSCETNQREFLCRHTPGKQWPERLLGFLLYGEKGKQSTKLAVCRNCGEKIVFPHGRYAVALNLAYVCCALLLCLCFPQVAENRQPLFARVILWLFAGFMLLARFTENRALAFVENHVYIAYGAAVVMFLPPFVKEFSLAFALTALCYLGVYFLLVRLTQAVALTCLPWWAPQVEAAEESAILESQAALRKEAGMHACFMAVVGLLVSNMVANQFFVELVVYVILGAVWLDSGSRNNRDKGV